ncbi:hypothetical protein CPB84DRAFT_1853133 [Gymnopilus junonius]|uniref:F-box domain-containing protein n=1 Tax=Gymnopilus junonius TaxID=109634 RepID=A0A9P5TGS7_GYMJU|nr:hypothetical protein CPB84DRAFT_1853133 [Gymnopilus junonius]
MPSDGTQTPQENAPISKLSDDILHYIFSINTDLSLLTRWTYYGLYYRRPASQSSFLTLLRCSHVSSDWRNTILLSPILWAAVFDLRYLRNHEWMEEVIRRTGQAPLSIIGEGRNFKISERVFRYLEENWERISYMDVLLTNFIPRISSDILEGRARAVERVLCLLQRPAPLLEICWFDIRFHSVRPVTSSERIDDNLPDGFRFFNNHAPALVEFHSPILIDLRAPWLSQLRHLSLHGPLETADLLQALSSMPVLEILEDEQNSIISTHGQASLPTVCLPSLEECKIDSREPNSRPYLDLLTHISSPFSKICLNFSIRGILEPTELLGRYFEPLVAILKSFSVICGTHDATRVGLDIFTMVLLLDRCPPNWIVILFR